METGNEAKTDMPPRLLSLEFHTRFFPALVMGRLRPRESPDTSFSSTTGFTIILAICAAFVATGLPNAISHKSVIGWVIGGTGAAGILFFFVQSILAGRDNPPSYDRFLKGVFFFFVSLGLSAGVFTYSHHSLALGILTGAGGLIAGYLLGILGGLRLQCLGWISKIVNGIAALAAFGMLFVDLVMLAGRLLGRG